jgi:N-acetylglutamate synthase-like GNAT family acetyltransferase
VNLEAFVAAEITVRRARLSDVEAIAAFVNAARTHPEAGGVRVAEAEVADRFGAVGFLLAERDGQLVGLLGWQIENLVVRVTDFVLSPLADREAVGKLLVQTIEEEGKELLAEAILLFLPRNPSPRLIAYWEQLGYEPQSLKDLQEAWREAIAEAGADVQSVLVKRLRRDPVRRPA